MLVCVNVKLNGDVLLARLNVKLLDAIFAEDAEAHTLRVCARHFNDVLLT